MIHAAAKGEPYACFVRPDTRIPFMTMPDGVEALLKLAAAPRERLTRTAYNLAAFNPSAEEIPAEVHPGVSGRARSPGRTTPSGSGSWIRGPRTWMIRPRAPTGGFAPQYDFASAFRDYLIPTIRARVQRPMTHEDAR